MTSKKEVAEQNLRKEGEKSCQRKRGGARGGQKDIPEKDRPCNVPKAFNKKLTSSDDVEQREKDEERMI